MKVKSRAFKTRLVQEVRFDDVIRELSPTPRSLLRSRSALPLP